VERTVTAWEATRSWLFAAAPLDRLAVFRLLVYLFIPLDVLVTRTMGSYHAYADPAFYQPLFVGRLLPLPTPTHTLVLACQWLLVGTALLAATGRAPRLLGTVVFVLYFEWMIIAFSYGKVDHDRFAFLVALAVLATVGRARWSDRTESEAAGWALRMVQIAVVLTYFLAAFAKLRFGGIEWVNSATLARAVLRRGTFLAEPLLGMPWTLQAGQWFIVAFELASPVLLFANAKWRTRLVVFLVVFHVATYAGITIIFLPHVLCLAAFLPLEVLPRRLSQWRAQRARAPVVQ
jgi:Vitamin K-dependent gamma-carboxylase